MAVQGQHVVSKNASQNHTVLLSAWEHKTGERKRPTFQIDQIQTIIKEWGRTKQEKAFPWEGGFMAQGECLLSRSLICTSCHFRGRGFKTGARTPIFQWTALKLRASSQESRQSCVSRSGTRVQLVPSGHTSPWTTEACLALRSCPGLLLESRTPLSLSLSLCWILLPPRCPGVILENISEPGEQSNSLPNILPLSSDPQPKIQTFIQKELLWRTRQTPTRPILPQSSLGSPSQWPADHLMWTAVCLDPQFDSGIKTPSSSHDGSSKNQLSCGRPHLDDQVLWTHWGGGHPDECLLGGGVRKGNLWLSRSHWRCIRAPVWATLTKVWLTMGQSASLLSPKPTLYSGHSSSFSRPESGRDSAPPRETPSRPQLEDPTLGLSEDHQRDLPSFPYPMFTPLTCWHWPLSPHYQLTPKEPVG